MANYHPSDNELLEFSAGKLDWALAICVSAHVQMCPHCKNKVGQLNEIGGNLLSSAETSEVSPSSFGDLMAKIKSSSENSAEGHEIHTKQIDDTPRAKKYTNVDISKLPKVIQRLIPTNRPLKWSLASPSLRVSQLETGQDQFEVCFHKIKRGGKVAEHDHRGREVTLVLEGSFSDENGKYVPGDYVVKEPGEIHRPMATQDQDCLCFSVVEAPVKLTGLLGKVINPFLSVSPK